MFLSLTKRFALVAVAAAALATNAQAFTITAGNTTLEIDDQGGSPGVATAAEDAALSWTDWTVDGVDHLQAHAFFYRYDGMGDEEPVTSLPLTGSVFTPAAGPFPAVLESTYENATVKIVVEYTLTPGSIGSGKSDVGVTVGVTNKSGITLGVSIFEYADFDVNGTASDDEVLIDDNVFTQTDSGTTAVSETVSAPLTNLVHVQADVVGSTGNILAVMDDGLVTDLNDDLTAGPANVEWGAQWDFTLADTGTGSAAAIEKDLSIVPEPATAALLGLAGLAMIKRRR